MTSRKFLGLCVVALFAATQAQAQMHANFCQNRSEGNTRSICEGRRLPSDQVRNIKNHELVCTSNVDNYVRFPQTQVSHEEWSNLVSAGQKEEAFKLKRKLPAVQWSGSIPYETVEEWEYEECELVTRANPCGTHEVCSDVTTNVPVYDADGNQTGTKEETKRECTDEPNTCYTDVTHSASQLCSSESMTFNAHYERPSVAQWNTKSPGYFDVIPNKYDLLPGEAEVVQVYNSNRRSSVLSPAVTVGDNWNEYKFRISGSGVGASCRQNANYSINVTVDTVKRDTSKATPNAFRLPVDWDGKAIDPIIWKSGIDRRSKKTVDNAIPDKLQLDDTSAGIISLMAEQSRRNVERETTKIANGKGANAADRAAFQQIGKKSSGYWKSTQVRVKLYRQRKYWWDTFKQEEIVNEIDAIAPSMKFLSENEEVKFSDFWTIPLTGDLVKANGKNRDKEETIKGIFEERKLKPNRAYTMEISVYQSRVPFYQQSCDDAPEQTWRCAGFWRALGLGIHKNTYFSKPLKIAFRAPKDYDGRGWWNRSGFANAPDNFATWISGGDVKINDEAEKAIAAKAAKKAAKNRG